MKRQGVDQNDQRFIIRGQTTGRDEKRTIDETSLITELQIIVLLY